MFRNAGAVGSHVSERNGGDLMSEFFVESRVGSGGDRYARRATAKAVLTFSGLKAGTRTLQVVLTYTGGAATLSFTGGHTVRFEPRL